MQRKLWILLTLLLVLPAFLLTASCAKKTVKSSTTTQAQPQQSVTAAKPADTAAAEKAKQEEAARKAAEEAARLKAEEEARKKAEEAKRAQEQAAIQAARQMFENEDIYFEFDKSRLLPAAQDVLKRKAQWLFDNPVVTIVIEGHCDERGTNEYNLALGERRANSAKMFLQDLGVAASRMTTISYGEERPVDPGHNEEAWAKNRRAHFVIE